MEDTTTFQQTITVRRQQAGMFYAVFGIFMVLFFVCMMAAALVPKPAMIVSALIAMVLLLFGLIYLYRNRIAPKVELALGEGRIVESRIGGGVNRDFTVADIKEYGLIKDNKGNVWMRLRLHSGGPMLRYIPIGFKAAPRELFRNFGNELRRQVDSFNATGAVNSQSIHSSSTGTQSTLLSPTPAAAAMDAPKIKTGLSTSEKATNKMVLVMRIFFAVIVLIWAFATAASSDHPGLWVSVVLIGLVALIVYSIISSRKRPANP